MYDLLKGMTVVEGAAFVAAPLCGMTLAQLGAEVIRFDQIGGGPDYQRWELTRSGRSLYWMGLNKGKKSIAVDFRTAEGQELVTRLISMPGADRGIFLTNFPMRGWLSHDSLCRTRGDLITAQITGSSDGQTAVDYTVNCAVGIPYSTGHATLDRPVNNMLPAWDIATGLTAATGILAAERKRARDGSGQLLTLALSDVAMAMISNLGMLGEAELNGTNRPALGNDVYGAFGRDFGTADGRRVMVTAFTPKQCRALAAVIDGEDAFGHLGQQKGLDPQRPEGLFGMRDDVAALVAPWCAARTLAEIGEAFDAAGVCWGPYQTYTQLLAEDPRCSPANAMFETVDQPGVGAMLVPGSPLSFDGIARRDVTPAPVLGQHTDEVLADGIGLSGIEIARLHDRGIVAGPPA